MRMALSGVAKEASRIVPVATLTSATGHAVRLHTLRHAFSGREFKRGQEAYRHLKALYRGSRTMEEYLAAIGQALAQCTTNGYTMSSKTAGATLSSTRRASSPANRRPPLPRQPSFR